MRNRRPLVCNALHRHFHGSKGVQLKGVKLVTPLDVEAETGDVAR